MIKENNIKINELLGYVFIVSSQILFDFEITTISLSATFYNIFLFIALGSLAISIFFSSWTYRELYRAIFIIALSFCVYYSSKESLILFLVGTCLIVKVLGYTNVLKTLFITRLAILLLVLNLAFLHVVPNELVPISKGSNGWVSGRQLGFMHPNGAAVSIFILILIFICIKKIKTNYFDILVVFLIELITTYLTKNRTTFILSLFLIVGLILLKNDLLNTILRKASIIYVILITGISIIFPMIYSWNLGPAQSFIFKLNGSLNGRLYNASLLFNSFKVTYFGQMINLDYLQQRFGYNVVDNGYTFMLFDYGIVGFILIMFLYFYAINSLLKKKQYVYVWVLILFLSLGVMENTIRTLAMNFTTIFWFEYISKKKEKN